MVAPYRCKFEQSDQVVFNIDVVQLGVSISVSSNAQYSGQSGG